MFVKSSVVDKIKDYTFWLIALLSPLNAIMLTIVFLIIVDFITGCYSAIKKKIPIEAEKIKHSVSKFFLYNLVIISAFLLEKYIIKEIPFLKIISGFIALAEIKSIMENFNRIYGINPFKVLVEIIKKGNLKSAIDELNKNDENEKS